MVPFRKNERWTNDLDRSEKLKTNEKSEGFKMNELEKIFLYFLNERFFWTNTFTKQTILLNELLFFWTIENKPNEFVH